MDQTFPQTAVLVRTGAERATLVRRTYLLVLAGIALTIVGVGFTLTQPRLLALVAKHPILTFLFTLAPLFMAQRAKTQYPANIGLTLLFTFAIGVWISPLMLYYASAQPGVIGQAGLLTFSAFSVLTAYAWISKRDFSAWGSFFVVGLWVLIATSLLNLWFKNESAALWLSGMTVMIFSGLLIFDTWRLRNVYGPDEYVDAAVAIYLDLLNMFLAILHLLGGRRD